MAAPISPPSKRWEGFLASRRDLAAQFVLDMDADDLVERRFGLKAKRERAAGIEPAPPAGGGPRHPRGPLAAGGGRPPFRRGGGAARDAVRRRGADPGDGEGGAPAEPCAGD